MTVQVRWRKNPKTEEGWLKRTAIALLVAVAGFAVSFPAAFALILHHLHTAYPKDTENFLAAMTSAVLAGLLVAGLGFFAALAGLWVLSFRERSKAT